MTLRFGTDGVRGRANTELTPELALALGRAAAEVLGGERFVVGRDPRQSGAMLEAAFAAGLASAGADVALAGVVPTPAVAFHAQRLGVPGAMVSASHNPYADNGIKLFAAGGRKLPDAVESAVEAALDRVLAGHGDRAERVGRVDPLDGAESGYLEHLTASLAGRRLDGLRLVVDCANGAASRVGPSAFRHLGADVVVDSDEPDGRNINDQCGALHPERLAERVVAEGADLGLAFDGDADRLIAVDGAGKVVDGDHVIAICAIDRHERGVLAGDTVVVTVMANLGFKIAMRERGIGVCETAVGDRYVLEAMEQGGFGLGGEQSGHVVFAEHATTGDGVLTGLQLVDVMLRTGRSLAELAAAAMQSLPQVLRNVQVARRDPAIVEHLGADIEAATARLGDHGRVLIRPSGTEPLIRVMVEAPTQEQAEAEAALLSAAVQRAAEAAR